MYLKKHFRKQKANLTLSMKKGSDAIKISDENIETCTEQTMTSEGDITNKPCHDTEGSYSISETPFKARREGSTKPRSNTTDGTSVAPSNRMRKTISHQQIEVTKNLFIVVCCFLACFVPYFVLNPILRSSHAIYYIRILPFSKQRHQFCDICSQTS